MPLGDCVYSCIAFIPVLKTGHAWFHFERFYTYKRLKSHKSCKRYFPSGFQELDRHLVYGSFLC